MAHNIDCNSIICLVLISSLLCLQTSDHALAKAVQNTDEETDGFFEGDILIDKTTWNVITNQTDENKRSAVTDGVKLWPGATVPYVIHYKMESPARNAIRDAITELSQKTCARFIPRQSHHRSYVRFYPGNGCYSYVGRTTITTGQVISVGSGCETKGIVLHEMMHALGFFHTSSRTDRDYYVTVYRSNVIQGFEINFQKYNHGQIDSFGTPYDINSLMHLPGNAFVKAKGLRSIVAKAGASVILGQRNTMSPIDIYQINALYNCGPNTGCFTALGLQSRAIADAAMTASSFRNKWYRPDQGRLHNSPSVHGNGAWCASKSDSSPWIEVYLGANTVRVSAIATQGMLSYTNPAYITKYDIVYKKYSYYNWTPYQADAKSAYGATNGLPGNWDETSVQHNALTPTFYARYVRLITRLFVGRSCVRIEIYGCKVNT